MHRRKSNSCCLPLFHPGAVAAISFKQRNTNLCSYKQGMIDKTLMYLLFIIWLITGPGLVLCFIKTLLPIVFKETHSKQTNQSRRMSTLSFLINVSAKVLFFLHQLCRTEIFHEHPISEGHRKKAAATHVAEVWSGIPLKSVLYHNNLL